MEPHLAQASSPAQKGQNSKSTPALLPMLTVNSAWRLLCRRTGGTISRTTFYRWINSGRVAVVRVGFRLLIPLPMLEEVVQRCLDGERI